MNCFLQKATMAAEKECDDDKQLVSNLLSKIIALEERLKVCDKNLYEGKSQKGIHKKKREFEEEHTCDKDDFDGILQSLESSLAQSSKTHAREVDGEGHRITFGLSCLST